MSNAFHYGSNHIFTNRNGSQESSITLKAGLNETLVIDGDIAGDAAGITFEGNEDFLDPLVSFDNYEYPSVLVADTFGNPEMGKAVRIDGNNLIVNIPNYENLAATEEAGFLYWTKSGTTWTYQAKYQCNLFCGSSVPDSETILDFNGNLMVQGDAAGNRLGVMELSGGVFTDASTSDSTGYLPSLGNFVQAVCNGSAEIVVGLSSGGAVNIYKKARPRNHFVGKI